MWLRLGPERPLDRATSVPVGERLPVDWLPEARGERLLALFISPSCGICEAVLRDLARLLSNPVDVVFVCQASEAEARAYLGRYDLAEYPVIPDPTQARSQQAGVHDIPFAVLVDGTQTVLRTAIVNSSQQVEAILESRAA